MVVSVLCRQNSRRTLLVNVLSNHPFFPYNSARSLLGSRQLSSNGSDDTTTITKGQWITGSLSGAKHISKLVPPTSSPTCPNKHLARLLVSGPDATGIVASFSQLLYGHGCGIVDCTSESSEEDDYNDNDNKNGHMIIKKDHSIELRKLNHGQRMFFQRILFDYSNISVEKRSLVESEIHGICEKFGMEYQLVSTIISIFERINSYTLCTNIFNSFHTSLLPH